MSGAHHQNPQEMPHAPVIRRAFTPRARGLHPHYNAHGRPAAGSIPGQAKLVSGDIQAPGQTVPDQYQGHSREHRPRHGRHGESDPLSHGTWGSGGGRRRLSQFFPATRQLEPCWRWQPCRLAPPFRWTPCSPTGKAPSRKRPCPYIKLCPKTAAGHRRSSNHTVAFSPLHSNIGAQLPGGCHHRLAGCRWHQEQAAQCLRNIKKRAGEHRCALDDGIVSVTVYLTSPHGIRAPSTRSTAHLLPGLRHRPRRCLSASPPQPDHGASALPLGARVQMDAVISPVTAPAPAGGRQAQPGDTRPQHRQGTAQPAPLPERRLLPLQPSVRAQLLG